MDAAPALDDRVAARVRESFAAQGAMRTLGARLGRLEPGLVEILFERRAGTTQQHGYLHAGLVAAAVDSACGYAALTRMPPGSEVLSVEFKVNFVAPARGERFLARGRVERAGRTLTVCRGEAVLLDDGAERSVALMQATMIRLEAP